MKPDISEFSYGFALTDELIQGVGAPLSAAPLFPSLYEEGRTGGYDVNLRFQDAFILFLQFKLSHFMKGRNAREFQQGLFTHPFYRLHLRPRRHSRQHRLLLDLEKHGSPVYYAAPAFHTSDELNQFYLNKEVIVSSYFISPSAIGPLPDDDAHHVAFRPRGTAYFLSEPSPVRVLQGEVFLRELASVLDEASDIREVVVPLSEQMLTIIDAVRQPSLDLEPLRSERFFVLSPFQRVAYLARTFFDSEPFVVYHPSD